MLLFFIRTPWVVGCHIFSCKKRKLYWKTGTTQTYACTFTNKWTQNSAGAHSGWKYSSTTGWDTRVQQKYIQGAEHAGHTLNCCLFIIPSFKKNLSSWLFWDFGFFTEAKKKPLCGDLLFKKDEIEMNSEGITGKVSGCSSFRSWKKSRNSKESVYLLWSFP